MILSKTNFEMFMTQTFICLTKNEISVFNGPVEFLDLVSTKAFYS